MAEISQLVFCIREGGEVIDVEEGHLCADVVSEGIEASAIRFLFREAIVFPADGLQDGDGFLSSRYGEDPVMVT